VVSIDAEAIPVTILGSSAYWGLDILRSLGRLGIPLYAVSANSQEPAFFSRYCSRKIVSEVCEFKEQSVQALSKIGGMIGRRSILITTNDRGAIFVADHADALKEWFIFPSQGAHLVRSLCNKKELYYLAKRLDIRTPEAAFPQSKQDVSDFLETASFPIMLKAINGWRQLERNRPTSAIIHTEHELLQKYDSMEDPEEPNLILQEYIPGSDGTTWMFNGYFNQESDCLLGFTGKKNRQWPVHHGVTTLGICSQNATIDKTARRFMKEIGYVGIVDIDYRYDARDGHYKLLDVNPRVGTTFRLFVGENGMDVVRALYLDLMGKHIVPETAREGRKWLVEDLDMVSSILCHVEGELPLGRWIDSYRGVQEAAYFALDDPLPALQKYADVSLRLCSRLMRLKSPEFMQQSRNSRDPRIG
jgi:D-aspartate ligase